MRLVFAGTPAVALPSLEALVSAGHEVVAVLTRPPAAQGRGRRLVSSPVQDWAQARGVECLTPSSAKDPALAEWLARLAPDCCPVVAYGGLVPGSLLDMPRFGWINLHFSLLPRHRGAAPVQHAILAGDTITGATAFRLVAALDAGPVYGSLTAPIGPTTTAGELLDVLAHEGAGLLAEAVAAAGAGVEPHPQPDSPVSLAPKVTLDGVRLDWAQPAERLDRLIRAANPQPGAWTVVDGRRLTVLLAEATDEAVPPGEMVVRKREVLVGTGTTALRLLDVVPEGRRSMLGPDWARGLRRAVPLSAEWPKS